jgi:DNA polymerase-3 subunit alpha
MLLSRQLAILTRGQSDTLRKAMGKKQIQKMNELEELFYKGGQANGHKKEVLNKIWEDWKKFASYAFNKSHATCYSWVSYQTAYLKAHYPAEYMAAVMSRNLDNISEITKLMDECKSMGISTLGPDINESRRKFSVNQKGEIRFGLAAIKGMGASAADAILMEREKNGPFKDAFDVVERVNLSNVNRKALESLVLSGGFDSFGISRERYMALTVKGEVFLDVLVRFGQHYQFEQQQAAHSLFGLDQVEVTTPPIPEAERWSNIERLNKERDLVGIYLSAHPLDEYSLVLKFLCNTMCSELEDKELLAKKTEVVFGGIVTGVVKRFNKRGMPFGIVTIEDFNGSGEIPLFGEEWGRWQGMFIEGSTVFVKAKSQPRYRDSNVYDLRISEVQYMQTVKEQNIEKVTIRINSEVLDSNVVEELSTLVEQNPGKTQLYLQIKDVDSNDTVTLKSRLKGVGLSKDLLYFMENTMGMDYYIN